MEATRSWNVLLNDGFGVPAIAGDQVLGDHLPKLKLRPVRIARVREMKPVREPEHVSVHGDGRDAEAVVEEDVRYLPAHPGQCDQGIEIVGRLPAVRLAQDPA